MKTYDLNDGGVVVIVGSGAGGGTLANELAQKGIDVVLLEAGKQQSIDTFINDEWESFAQLAWLDKRTTSGNWRVAKRLPEPAGLDLQDGGRHHHPLGRRLAPPPGARVPDQTVYGDIDGANLLDWPLTLPELEPYYARAEDKMGVTRTNGIPGLPGNNNFKVLYTGAKRLGYKEVHTGRMAINSEPRHDRPSCQQIGFCFQGCKAVRSGARSSPRSRPRSTPASSNSGPRARSLRDPARRFRQGHGRPLRRQGRPAARAKGPRRLLSPATRSRARGCSSIRPRPSSRTASPTARARSAGTTCGT